MMPHTVEEEAMIRIGRQELLATRAELFANALRDENPTLDQLREFVEGFERQIHPVTQEMTAHLLAGEKDLSAHANRARSLAVNLVLLRGGFLPALEIDSSSVHLREQAIQIIAYIRTELELTSMYLD
jgi:hypothetical protein